MTVRNTPTNPPPRRKPRDTGTDELSLDTRLAAQEILRDDSIGVVREVERPPVQSGIIEWLEERRMKLTLMISAVTALVIFIPVWLQVGQRHEVVQLNDALAAQAAWIVEKAGPDQLKRWIEARNVEQLRSFYRDLQPDLVDRLVSAGFPVNDDSLSVRVDYDRGELFLGALIDHGDDGKFITWAGTEAGPPERPLPPATYLTVMADNRDLLLAIALVVVVLVMGIWLLPSLAAGRRRNPS